LAQPTLFHSICQLAEHVDDVTKHGAVRLLYNLPENLPVPEIVAEEGGEISLEWSEGPSHVAVLSVIGEELQWAGIGSAGVPVSGSAPLSRDIPFEALEVVREAIA